MSDIPSDVCHEILLRLPAESLFRFRAVCKEWRCLIDDPSFVKSHSNNQLSSNTLLFRSITGVPLYLVSLDSIDFNDYHPQTIHAIPIKQLIRNGVPRLRSLPQSSCNGLILISDRESKKIWTIWNPLTRECHELPPQPHPPTPICGMGLGYDYATDDYKVVRINLVRDPALQVPGTLVYSMKLGSWSMAKDCPYRLDASVYGVFLNGALHWLSREFIVAFDIGTEDYRALPLPQECTNWLKSLMCNVNLDAMGGCLILSYSVFRKNCVHGWVMNDYGVEKSWMKLFSLKEFGYFESVRPVAYLKDKKQVLLQSGSGRAFILVGVADNSVKKVTIDDYPGISSAQIYPGSLVRLGDRVKRKRKNTRGGTRLNFWITNVNDSCCISSSGVGSK